MEALQKPISEQELQTGPAEQAGVLLETINIFPPEFKVLYDAMSRITELQREHGEISLWVRHGYEAGALSQNQIEVYI